MGVEGEEEGKRLVEGKRERRREDGDGEMDMWFQGREGVD